MRKLLPYEYQLIETLGITKEEYLEFVAIQQDYKDPKDGTAFDIRNGPATQATVAIVLTVVGTLFQIGAALLAPKPEIPDVSDRRRRNREQRFAPTYGFNSAQELATYGDPVNLVYTNQNKLGDVRVAGSLVWSAVDNFGSTQFMRLLLVIGAGKIQRIKYGKTAFGQTSLSDLDRQNVFIFKDKPFDEANVGPPRLRDMSTNFANTDLFPQNLRKGDDSKQAFVIPTPFTKVNGYSQAYTPTTSSSLGVFDAIPINVDVKARDKDGDREEANILIKLRSSGGTANDLWRNYKSGALPTFNKTDTIELSFAKKDNREADDAKKPAKTAVSLRRQMLESLDFGSTYMLGSAKFRLKGITEPRSIDSKEVKAEFVCVESGKIPGTPYNEQDPVNQTEDTKEVRRGFEKAKRLLSAPNEDFDRDNINASKIIPGNVYRITGIDQVDFKEIGASENKVDIIFVADATPTNASASDTVTNGSVQEIEFIYGSINFSFKGTETVKWNPEYVATVSKNFNINNRQYTDAEKPEDRIYVKSSLSVFDERSTKINRFGSINYTKSLLEDHTADKPTLKTKSLRRQINEQIQRLNRLKNKVEKSEHFDGIDGKLLRCRNDFEGGFRVNTGQVLNTQVREWDENHFRNIAVNQATGKREYHHLENRAFTGVKAGNGNYYFTFIYIDSAGRWNLFNFNGIQQKTTSDVVFPNDPGMNNKRARIIESERSFFNRKSGDRLISGADNLIIIKDSAVAAGPRDNTGRTLLNFRSGIFDSGFTSAISSDASQKQRRVESVGDKENKLLDERRQEAIEVIDRDIELLEQLKSDIQAGDEEVLSGKTVRTGETDRVGTKAIKKAYRTLIEDKDTALGQVREALSDWDGFTKSFDNNFFSKCLVKAETASYSTLSEANMVNFSFKTKLFRRISGRENKYGDNKMREYSTSDNGVKTRMAFFRMSYQQYQSDGKLGGLIDVPFMIAIRHGSESDFYTQLSFYSPLTSAQGGPTKWRFVFTPVHDIWSEANQRYFGHYIFLENSTNQEKVKVNNEHISWYGRLVPVDTLRYYYPDEDERGPIYTNEWDMFSVNSDTQTQFSFEGGPEIQLTAVTEQQFDEEGNRTAGRYKNMSMMGIGVFAGRGLQDLRSITALVDGGKLCRTVASIGTDVAPTASSSYAPDIFVDTLLDEENGLGKYLNDTNLDKESLELAKRFCVHNNLPGNVNLFMDGLIADTSSWREFWIANAPFSLLELARKNGKDTLVPAIPVEDSGRAADDNGLPVGVKISALFTTGNILEGSYKEEFLNYEASTEDLIASVIYREYTTKEIFSQNRSVEVKRKNASDNAVRETFDLSQFVTQREQAILFGKLLCNQRRHIKNGIEFQTIPSQAPVEPGDFIYVDVGLKQWDGYSSGVIMPDTTLNAPLMGAQPDGVRAYNFLVYNKTTGSTSRFEDINVETVDKVSKAPSLAAYVGWMFVMGLDRPRKRVYRVTEIAIEEEGEVSIKAIEYPCFEEGGQIRARIADFRADKFEVS